MWFEKNKNCATKNCSRVKIAICCTIWSCCTTNCYFHGLLGKRWSENQNILILYICICLQNCIVYIVFGIYYFLQCSSTSNYEMKIKFCISLIYVIYFTYVFRLCILKLSFSDPIKICPTKPHFLSQVYVCRYVFTRIIQ